MTASPDDSTPRRHYADAAKRRLGDAVSAVLRWDERLVDRADPPPTGPYPVERLEWAEAVRSRAPEIADELTALLDRGLRLPTTTEFAGEDQYAQGSWTTYVMHWYGRWIDQTCSRMPVTTSVLRHIPDLQIGGFSVLGPRARLETHRGPAKSLRFQVGIIVPPPAGACVLRVGTTDVVWEFGAAVAFDDRSEHSAWNDTDAARYVLFAQVPWPIDGPVGRVHRTVHEGLGRLTGDYARRFAELDGALNGGLR